MIRLRLRHIVSADFKRNEATHLQDYEKEHGVVHLGKDDCILFVSRSGHIMRFVFGWTNEIAGLAKHVLSSYSLRCARGESWEPLMLGNYANEVGITLVGMKRFEEYYRHLLIEREKEREARKAARAARAAREKS